MSMQRRPSDTENKLLLLYAIERLGAVTAQQLLQFMVDNELMDYISMHLALAELDEAGHVRKEKHALGTLYALTGKGHDILDMFSARIPYSRHSHIDEIATVWKRRFRREKQMLSDFSKKDNGEYSVRLRLLENDADILDLTMNVPTREHAQRFCDAWIAQAASIYSHIMHSLGEGEIEPSVDTGTGA